MHSYSAFRFNYSVRAAAGLEGRRAVAARAAALRCHVALDRRHPRLRHLALGHGRQGAPGRRGVAAHLRRNGTDSVFGRAVWKCAGGGGDSITFRQRKSYHTSGGLVGTGARSALRACLRLGARGGRRGQGPCGSSLAGQNATGAHFTGALGLQTAPLCLPFCRGKPRAESRELSAKSLESLELDPRAGAKTRV